MQCVSNTDDTVQAYSCFMAYRGLLNMIHRDCVREGDGEAMISIWRFNMLEFWENNHPGYLKIGHRLLAGIANIPPNSI